MKLSKIKKACKANGICYILQDIKSDIQWISNGEAAYKLEGVWVDETSLRAIWDIPLKDWEANWDHKTVDISTLSPEKAEMISVVWPATGEIELEWCQSRVVIGEEYRRFQLPDGASVYALAMDFEPLSGNGRYMLRTEPGCSPVIAVYDDLLCQGVVAVLSQGAAIALRKKISEWVATEMYQW